MPAAQALLRFRRIAPAARVYMPFIAILKLPFKIVRPYSPQQAGKRQRTIRQSVGGLAIRLCALQKWRAIGRKTGSHFC
jgi:hypothetical protein